MSSVLIIDDEENLRRLLARVISLEGYTVHQAATIKHGLALLEREPINVVISDVKLPDGNGIDLTATLKKQYPAVEVIVLTAYGTIQDGVTAIKNGAFDYLTKGCSRASCSATPKGRLPGRPKPRKVTWRKPRRERSFLTRWVRCLSI